MAKKVLTPPTYAVNNVQQLPDQVVDDAPNVKQTFDKTGADTKTYLTNDLIAELQSEAADAGSYAIGHNSTLIASLNVGDALEENRQALTNVVLGEIPDNTLTEAKMANEMKKIAGGVYPYNDGDANKTSIDTLNDRTDYGKTVGGTGDAITITTVTGDWTFAVGESIKGIAIANSTGAVTCQVDGGTVYDVKKLDGSSYVACEANDFEDNKPFELIGQNDGGDFFLLAPKGANPIDKWNNTTVVTNLDNTGAAVTDVVNVVGSGWVIAVGLKTAGFLDYTLEIDGAYVLGDALNAVRLEDFSSHFLMIRFESSFDFSASSDYFISYILGDDFEKGDLNVAIDGTSIGTASDNVVVSGKGWLYGINVDNTGVTSGLELLVDGVTIFSDKATETSIPLMIRFETGFTLKYPAASFNNANVTYTLD